MFRTIRSSFTTYTHDELDLVLPIGNENSVSDYTVKVATRADGRIVLSYLVHDNDASGLDPMEEEHGFEFEPTSDAKELLLER